MSESHRLRRLQRTADLISRTQRRAAASRKSHRKKSVANLARFGITLESLRCCVLE
jgi:hypothetical protein